MTEDRLADYLGHMRRAAVDACGYVEDMSLDEFQADRRTQQAVVMNLVILGEAATRVMDQFPIFAEAHPEVPWRSMRGMRNRIAHGYFEVDFGVVWDTVRGALPELLGQLDRLGDTANYDR